MITLIAMVSAIYMKRDQTRQPGMNRTRPGWPRRFEKMNMVFSFLSDGPARSPGGRPTGNAPG